MQMMSKLSSDKENAPPKNQGINETPGTTVIPVELKLVTRPMSALANGN